LAALISAAAASRSALRVPAEFRDNPAQVENAYLQQGWSSVNEGSVNFHQLWLSAGYLLRGYNIYDPAVFEKYKLASPYLPNSFVFLFPFVPLGLNLAKCVWLALNLFFTVLIAWEIASLFWEKKYFPLLAALIVCSAPWGTLIHFGQCSLWSYYFFLLALRWDREKRPFLSGFALAFCLLKYVLTAPMLLYFLLYRRSWENVAIAVVIHAVIYGFFCLRLGVLPWELPFLSVQAAHYSGAIQNGYLDLFAFWSRIAGHSLKAVYFLSALALACGWSWTLLKLRQSGSRDDLGVIALTVMVALILMYHNIYDFVGAIFPLVWFFRKFPVKKEKTVLAVGIAALWVLFVSPHYFEFFPHTDWLVDFMKSDGYLLFLSLLWYLGLGFLWFQLKVEVPEPVRSV
jgi:hypothetical protein